jgi:uncharacterized protein (TIGR00255 family)
MIKSMTGFGASSLSRDEAEISVQVSSVNRDHLDMDISFNAKNYAALLPDIRGAVKQFVKRGKISVSVHIEACGGGKKIFVNEPLAREMLKKIRSMEKKLFPKSTFGINELLRMEGVVSVRTLPAGQDKLKKDILLVLRRALAQLDRMRTKEGSGIAADFSRWLSQMENLVCSIEKKLPFIESAYEKKLQGKIRNPETARDITPTEKDLMLKMVSLFADKIDIAEEISRLKSHIGQFRSEMRGGEKPGKTLNFIAQEMLREANTMGVKTPSIDAKKSVVELKKLIEEIKEQVSNVE